MNDQVRAWLHDIDETAMEVFDFATRERVKRKSQSQRRAYEKGLHEVSERAGRQQGRKLAEWIQAEMRETRRFPTARQVRKRGAKLVRESGHEVSTNDWLGA